MYGVATGAVPVRLGRGVCGADAVGTVAIVPEGSALVRERLLDRRGGILIVVVVNVVSADDGVDVDVGVRLLASYPGGFVSSQCAPRPLKVFTWV